MSPDKISQLEAIDKHRVWHAFTQMAEYEPWLVERANGCILIDAVGREYLDGVSSLWCNVHGHRHPHIDAAIRAQLDRVAHVTNLGMSNSTNIRLAEKLCRLAPAGLEHVFYSDSGASAVEVALKLAFQFHRQKANPEPQRTKYLALDAAYHGDTLGSVSVGGVARFHAMFEPLLFSAIRLPAPDTYRRPAGCESDDALLAFHLDQLDRVLAAHGPELSAMVVEPLIQCAAGMVMHPPGWLAAVRERTRQHGVLLIADEVAVGMGRTGKMFACEHESVSPDLLCLAKGLTGGYLPVAATLATSEIFSAFLGKYEESKTFFHGHTYGGNPLGCAAALATLEVFENERTLENLPAKVSRLSAGLAPIRDHSRVGDIRNRGLIFAIELVADRQSKEPPPWDKRQGQAVCDVAKRCGVWLRPLGNVLVVMPPLSISHDQIDQVTAAVVQGVREILG